MSTPGSGGPQPPEHDPSQSGQPASWGQQPPAGQPSSGQPYPGQQPPAGQPYPGQQPPAGQQPWGAAQQPGGPQQFGQQPGGAQAFGQPEKPKRKWLPIALGVLALAVVLIGLLSFLGGGDPEVGDCIKQEGADDFSVVDCDADDAERKVVGTDVDMTGEEFQAAPAEELCVDFPETTFVLWSGTDESEDGHVYCTSDV